MSDESFEDTSFEQQSSHKIIEVASRENKVENKFTWKSVKRMD